MKPKKPCNAPGCPKLTRGSYCEDHARPTYKTDTPRLSSRARGYDNAWERLRNAYRAQHPLCEACEAAGRVTLTALVHHVQPIDQRPDLRVVR